MIGLNEILMPLYIVCWLTAVLDIGSQYSLVTRETLLIGVRMFLKVLVATAWVILFIIYYRFVQLTDFWFRVLDFLSCVVLVQPPWTPHYDRHAWGEGSTPCAWLSVALNLLNLHS
jgi:hypothetical protein